MTITAPSGSSARDASQITQTAIRLLAERGFESTTVEELADAAQISRSTFFRRFGSKEDVVFADHDLIIERLAQFLADSTLGLVAAIGRGARMVLDYHLQQPEVALLRYGLLRSNPPLRDRELVITRRYERTFSSYIQRASAPTAPEWAPLAFGAAVVAVHNATLRRWLRDQGLAAGAALDRDLAELSALFAPLLQGESAPADRRVLVALFDPGAGTDEVLRGIEEQLRSNAAEQLLPGS